MRAEVSVARKRGFDDARTWFGALFIGAVFAIAGCRGGSSSLPSAPVSNDAAAHSAVGNAAAGDAGGTIVVVLPTIVAPKPLPTPSRPRHLVLFIVGHSIGLGIVRQNHVRSDRYFGRRVPTARPSAGGARSCTIQAKVHSGTSKLTLTTYGEKASFGRLAFVPKTQRRRCLPGVLNYVKPLKWFGVATGVKITRIALRRLSQFKPRKLH